MPSYFLDTSALAKRYHNENGSVYLDRILEQPGSRSVISNLSIVELESVLAIKKDGRDQSAILGNRPTALPGPILRGSASLLPRPLRKAISRAPGSWWCNTG